MTRKLATLSSIIGDMNHEEQVVWAESVKSSRPLLSGMEAWLTKQIQAVEKDMRIDKVTSCANPSQAMLLLQAKKEALADLLDLIVDK